MMTMSALFNDISLSKQAIFPILKLAESSSILLVIKN